MHGQITSKNVCFEDFFLKVFCVLTLCFKFSNAHAHALAKVWKFYLIINVTNAIKISSKFQGEKKSWIPRYQWTQRSTSFLNHSEILSQWICPFKIAALQERVPIHSIHLNKITGHFVGWSTRSLKLQEGKATEKSGGWWLTLWQNGQFLAEASPIPPENKRSI